ncbi:helix-turn-helix transcriptional regulator [Nocardiopsis sp. HNM0947]|uniref:Helix-turn-helix transcriptional regulator n=1 Tax=Nocardiopsis coralli TaxID=2772213 RepID=A0ABR9P2E6_9ACTN|nr:helix-turn-helix transcriptional regulator [Nocardiopsis coralli]MBE2997975.1 helix-turn-helix transcriptional regulator [Nocardiopsis coralli]
MSDSVLRDLDQARRGPRAQQPETRQPEGGQPATRQPGNGRPEPQRPETPRSDDPLMRDLIGELLRRARTEQRRTLREVAEDAQVSLPYLSEIERGRKEASSEVLAAVYRSLGLSLTDVLAELYHRAAPIRLARTGSYQVAPMPQQTPTTQPARQAQVLSLAA